MTVRRFSLLTLLAAFLPTSASVIVAFWSLQTQSRNAMIVNMAGAHFDPGVVDVFLKIIGDGK